MGDKVHAFDEVDQLALDGLETGLLQSITEFGDVIDRLRETVDGVSLEDMAGVVEHIGRRLRDDCCGHELRGEAIMVSQIMTIATTRMA